MKKSSIFIVLLLCIVVAELIMVFRSGAGEKSDMYVLDTKIYDMPVREAENKPVKPLLLDMQATDETDAILDEFAADITKAMASQKAENKEVQIVAPVDDIVSAVKELENQVLIIQDEKLIEPEVTEEVVATEEGAPESLLPVENPAPEAKAEVTEEVVATEEGAPESLLPAENPAPEAKAEVTEKVVATEEGAPESLLPVENSAPEAKAEVVEDEVKAEVVSEVSQEPKEPEKIQEQEAVSAEPVVPVEPVIAENNKVDVAVPEEAVVQKDEKTEKRAKIAIVIDDMGLNIPFIKQISQVKAPLTVSFLPYGASGKEQVTMLKNAGFEVMVHIPMMPHIPAALAPVTLSPEMDKSETQAELNKMLDRFAGMGIDGVNNHMGSLLTERVKNMEYVMEVLKKRGMFFLDSKTTGKSVAGKAAAEYGVTYIARDVFLDNKKDYNYIMGQFHQAEKVAQKNGYAVAIGHPYSQTLNVLQDWLKEADNRGFDVVHLSDLLPKQ